MASRCSLSDARLLHVLPYSAHSTHSSSSPPSASLICVIAIGRSVSAPSSPSEGPRLKLSRRGSKVRFLYNLHICIGLVPMVGIAGRREYLLRLAPRPSHDCQRSTYTIAASKTVATRNGSEDGSHSRLAGTSGRRCSLAPRTTCGRTGRGASLVR
ncbi:hypothetical protein OH76DRAFT_949174 [Lentinus brumalis]|uniref:Uncharacterized protein n=1 Tax=Lentinus brumalis TaxID=2498619 RepID=A0A371CZ78_9APHY|nr:hypothetical protein OH76DRAFT_949174 [Polyporus brumalis]